jgi:hypothetical protein
MIHLQPKALANINPDVLITSMDTDKSFFLILRALLYKDFWFLSKKNERRSHLANATETYRSVFLSWAVVIRSLME